MVSSTRSSRGRGRGGRGGRGRGGRIRRTDAEAAHSTSGDPRDSGLPEGEAQSVGGVERRDTPVPADAGPMGAMMGLLTQLLERMPAPVPIPEQAPPQAAAPEAPVPVADQRIWDAEVDASSYLRMMEHMQRLGTQFFHGGANPIEADEWRSRLERNFHSIRCPVEFQVDLAVHYLEGDAHTWWLGILARRGDADRMSWVDFWREFDAKYFPQEARDRLESQFLELSQGSRSVREYELEFNRLKRFVEHGFDDEQAQVRRFLKGLRADLRNHCIIREYETVSELVERAALLEDALRQTPTVVIPVRREAQSRPSSRGAPSAPSRGSRSVPQQRGQKRSREETSQASSVLRCYRCGVAGHRATECPRSAAVCYHCQEPGHLKRDCPRLSQTGSRPETQAQGQGTAGPRVYAIGSGSGEASGSRPITG